MAPTTTLPTLSYEVQYQDAAGRWQVWGRYCYAAMAAAVAARVEAIDGLLLRVVPVKEG